MRKSERSTYTPLDFLEWYNTGGLVISPKFQRRSVWSRAAKSYLIDTLLLELPVPPIYLRLVQSASKTKVVREVVDGQQRITAILEFLNGEFSLANNIESECKGKKFDELNSDQKDKITQFSLICEIFRGVDDREILQVFSRMNMNSVKLNEQELRNGKYFGPFKKCSYDLAWEHLEFWRKNKIFTESGIARMKEVELTSELIISMLAGMQDKKKSISSFYQQYDEIFPRKIEIEKQFKKVIDEITEIFNTDLKLLEFSRPPIFYSMFLTLYHRIYGLPESTLPGGSKKRLSKLDRTNFKEAVVELSSVVQDYKNDEESPSSKSLQRFIDACITSTDTIQRRRVRLSTLYNMAFK